MHSNTSHDFYEAMYVLDDERKFAEDVLVQKLIQTTAKIEAETAEQYASLLGKLEREIQSLHRKWVYVGIKWLIFIHRVLQKTKSIFMVEYFSRIFQGIKQPRTQGKFQQYILSKLYNPYCIYIQKIIILQNQWRAATHDDSQNHNKQHIIYSQYNLIIYLLGVFKQPIKEFTPYLSKHYPILNQYQNLIKLDMHKMYEKVSYAFNKNTIDFVTLIQIQNMGSTIEAMRNRKLNLLEETKTDSMEMASKSLSPICNYQISQFSSTALFRKVCLFKEQE